MILPTSPPSVNLGSLGRQQLLLTFDGERIVSDTGLLAVRAREKPLRVSADSAEHLPAPRPPRPPQHPGPLPVRLHPPPGGAAARTTPCVVGARPGPDATAEAAEPSSGPGVHPHAPLGTDRDHLGRRCHGRSGARRTNAQRLPRLLR